jgi:alanine racemase
MMVDVTEIPDAAVDDPVVLMGEDGGKVISAEVLAAACDSFPYELISNVGHRCLRQYYEKGCLKETVDYLL